MRSCHSAPPAHPTFRCWKCIPGGSSQIPARLELSPRQHCGAAGRCAGGLPRWPAGSTGPVRHIQVIRTFNEGQNQEERTGLGLRYQDTHAYTHPKLNPNQFQKAHFDIIAEQVLARQQRAVAYIPISIPCPGTEPGWPG